MKNGIKRKKIGISGLLYISGGVILVCSLFFAATIIYGYITTYGKAEQLATGIFIAVLAIISGSYLCSMAFGVRRIITLAQNVEEKLRRIEQKINEAEDN